MKLRLLATMFFALAGASAFAQQSCLPPSTQCVGQPCTKSCTIPGVMGQATPIVVNCAFVTSNCTGVGRRIAETSLLPTTFAQLIAMTGQQGESQNGLSRETVAASSTAPNVGDAPLMEPSSQFALTLAQQAFSMASVSIQEALHPNQSK
ncbi:MAG TPA: hypothetical protein VKZ53_04900 [Candidatus Angelobacter sp.]|nr:hypothetical protein [Candidatus Angelobacter sp.]